MESLSPTTVQIAGLLGARYVVAEPGAELLSEGEHAVVRMPVVYDGRDARVFENPRALPRAIAAPRERVVEDEAAASALLADPEFDLRREVVVERADAGAVAGLAGGSSPGTVSVADRSNAEVDLRARLTRRALVMLDDSLTPGWSVRVDGHAARVVRVDDVMRGVVVPAGAHAVVWRYRVPGLRAGVALSVLGLLVVAGLGVPLVRARRSRRGALPGAAAPEA